MELRFAAEELARDNKVAATLGGGCSGRCRRRSRRRRRISHQDPHLHQRHHRAKQERQQYTCFAYSTREPRIRRQVHETARTLTFEVARLVTLAYSVLIAVV